MSEPFLDVARRTPTDMPDGPIRERLLDSINLMDNNIRGLMAEVLVAEAVGAVDDAEAWASWDVTTTDGIRIEVKSSGYIQSWMQARRSSPAFDIAPKRRLENDGSGHWPNPLHGDQRRWSDVYVFCLHDGLCPDLVEEWTFYPVSTSKLDETCGDQKQITLGSLIRRLNPEACGFDGLDSAIRQVNRTS